MPVFGDRPFSDIRPILIKKFIAKLIGHKKPNGEKLSGKRIQNINIPLRAIVYDAIAEYGWVDFPDPFFNLKLPGIRKRSVSPFSYNEWQTFKGFIPNWYLNYFEFAVLTGLRPSEQVALKWKAINDEYIHIGLSRVRNQEKVDLKNEYSRRDIELQQPMRVILDRQREQVEEIESPYVFLTPKGTPIIQDRLREQWAKAMKASGLPYRRMYETRHTFASWALAAGESSGWVARTLGHADTSMVYRH
ncbi:MAG: site-specific integrase, partial [Deltaproteobacteria bacterium]|nr:site-specific integrase [Deltaproteobacteria bacterium]